MANRSRLISPRLAALAAAQFVRAIGVAVANGVALNR